MKKNAIRAIAIALVLLMALALVPLASWADGPYTVTFHSNYPNGAQNVSVERPTNDDGQLTIGAPGDYGISTPQGYTFTSWNGNPSGGATSHEVGKVVTLTDHSWDIYAQWAGRDRKRHTSELQSPQ